MKPDAFRPRKVSVVVATYNRADYLRLSLACLLAQDYGSAMQIVVADDGSTDKTADVLEGAREASANIPILHCWHEHAQYRRARTLNGGVLMSDGDLLVFLDSDCLPARNLVSVYAAHAAEGCFYLGGVYGLSQPFSQGTLADGAAANVETVLARAADRDNQVPGASRRVWGRYWKSRLYVRLNLRKPKIWGGNLAVNRHVFEQVNGFDENFVGHGQEDSDLRDRLFRGGFSPICLHTKACAYHLWHPVDLKARQEALGDGNNRPYYRRPRVDVVCRNGLRKLSVPGAGPH